MSGSLCVYPTRLQLIFLTLQNKSHSLTHTHTQTYTLAVTTVVCTESNWNPYSTRRMPASPRSFSLPTAVPAANNSWPLFVLCTKKCSKRGAWWKRAPRRRHQKSSSQCRHTKWTTAFAVYKGVQASERRWPTREFFFSDRCCVQFCGSSPHHRARRHWPTKPRVCWVDLYRIAYFLIIGELGLELLPLPSPFIYKLFL